MGRVEKVRNRLVQQVISQDGWLVRVIRSKLLPDITFRHEPITKINTLYEKPFTTRRR